MTTTYHTHHPPCTLSTLCTIPAMHPTRSEHPAPGTPRALSTRRAPFTRTPRALGARAAGSGGRGGTAPARAHWTVQETAPPLPAARACVRSYVRACVRACERRGRGRGRGEEQRAREV